jgi:ABC-type bacteriocin/lantibiotic exporter with double-glycine peptidase domain
MGIWNLNNISNLPGTSLPRKAVATNVIINDNYAGVTFKLINYDSTFQITIGKLAQPEYIKLIIDDSILHNSVNGTVVLSAGVGTFTLIKDLMQTPTVLSIDTVLTNWLNKKITDGVFNT